MPRCPTCLDPGLQHILVADSLPAHLCPNCNGLLIGLVAYRRWREIEPISSVADAEHRNSIITEDTKNAKACTKCKSVMTKYRISSDAPNRIDFCVNCEDIWLDDGEWELIDSLIGSKHLATITTQPWQRRIRKETVKRMEHERLESVFGDEYVKVSEFAEWLEGHESRDEILAYLQRNSI
jgi:Zn-finger nucleic acid-binding protein